MEPLRLAWHRQKESAKKRGIGFDISFDDWLDVWNQSGKLHLRGKKAGCYCMMRRNDMGAYVKDNVTIGAVSENIREANKKNWGKKKHYPKTTLPPLARLYEKVVRIPESGCHVWTGSVIYGYGQTSYLGKKIGAHRLSYLLNKGEIPEGMLVCHSCDVPSCVNPDHLFLGSAKQNAQDKVNKNRQSRMGGPKGEKHPSAKLTAQQVLEIRQSDLGCTELSVRLGITKGVVSKIKRHELWRSV